MSQKSRCDGFQGFRISYGEKLKTLGTLTRPLLQEWDAREWGDTRLILDAKNMLTQHTQSTTRDVNRRRNDLQPTWALVELVGRKFPTQIFVRPCNLWQDDGAGKPTKTVIKLARDETNAGRTTRACGMCTYSLTRRRMERDCHRCHRRSK